LATSADLTGSTQHPGDKTEGPPTIENAKQRGYGVVSPLPLALDHDLIWAAAIRTNSPHPRCGKIGKTSRRKAFQPGARSPSSKLRACSCVAYAAVDRSRLDDRTPILSNARFWSDLAADYKRISTSAFVRAIREDTEIKDCSLPKRTGSFTYHRRWRPLAIAATQSPTTSVRD